MIRLLLVDDEPLICRGLKALLELEQDLEIVGEAENGRLACELAESMQPDVVLMDLRMPVMDGVAATQYLKTNLPHIKVLILTTFGDREYLTQSLRGGAVGYLLKNTPSEELAQAIRMVHRGYTQLSPGLGETIANQLPATPNIDRKGWDELTPREREILQLIAQGANNREIAATLFIAEKTVKNHITNILSRLELRDRTQAAIYVHSILELKNN
jgi:DNA-binding NarL/FixJ family response regulator